MRNWSMRSGNYALTVSHNNYVSRYVAFEVLSRKTTSLQVVQLNKKTGSAVGKLDTNDEGLHDLAYIPVYARTDDNDVYMTISNERGFFKFNSLPVDRYSFIVVSPDFQNSKIDNQSIVANTEAHLGTLNLVGK